MAGTAGALQESGDGTRRADLADQIHVADVDAQFQRRGGHQCPQLTALQPLFRVEALVTRKAAMMRGDVLRAQPFRQMARRPFGQAARVDEDERSAMFIHQRGEPVVDLRPHLIGHHRFQG